MIDENLLKREEKAIITLRSLYRKYGYMPYKMNKFEEYELYMRNKEFLVSDRIITFNDTNGKLLALKPDVTLSIIKNGEDIKGYKQKVYYNENVYRVPESSRHYKEIMQAGLECIGDIDLYDIYETVTLAARSLSLISDNFVLEVSHLDILYVVLEEACDNEDFRSEAIKCISEKNLHDLKRICNKYDVNKSTGEKLEILVTSYGNRDKVIENLKKINDEKINDFVRDLICLSKMIDCTEIGDRVFFDFSAVNNMNYYNGVTFSGFIDGVSKSVLSGGQYDKMMKKMGRKSKAIGFAIYLDMLEQIREKKRHYDIDVLLLYDNDTDICRMAEKISELTESGLTVSAQKTIPAGMRFDRITDMRKESK